MTPRKKRPRATRGAGRPDRLPSPADELPEVTPGPELEETPEAAVGTEAEESTSGEATDRARHATDDAEAPGSVATGAAPRPSDAVEEPVEEPVERPVERPIEQPVEQLAGKSVGERVDVDAEGVDAVLPYPGQPGPAASSNRAWRRLSRAARPRPTKANVLATLLALGLGFAIAAQVRQTSIEGLEDLREDELIRILDTVDQDGNRLAEELQTLRVSRDRLQSDTTSLTEARAAAQQRLDSLAILTGTSAARGPGIVLTIRDPEFGVTAPMLLDTLQELRDAGAEAIEINDKRIVANTYFTDTEGGISISGSSVSAPYVITAIGDGSTLASAMEIPGGVTNTVRSVGGEATVETEDEVTVSALQSVSEPQYARPVPSPTTS